MKYKLYDDYITLQALLKELGIIQSGGAVKRFLGEETVLFNGEDEKRRGKKIRVGDVVTIPKKNIVIEIVEPNSVEKQEHIEELAEKERVSAIVKKLNQENKKAKSGQIVKEGRKAIRFPGT